MNAGDNSLVGGLISASTLMLCHVALARLAFHFPAHRALGRWQGPGADRAGQSSTRR
jgi:hypothetical protein